MKPGFDPRAAAFVNAGRERDRLGQIHNDALGAHMRGEIERRATAADRAAERDAAAHAAFDRQQKIEAIAGRYPAADVAAVREACELDKARALLAADERAAQNPFRHGEWRARNSVKINQARALVNASQKGIK